MKFRSSLTSCSGQILSVESLKLTFCKKPIVRHACRFPGFDDCELGPVFESRAQTMKTVPFFSRSAFRAALRISGGNHVWVGPCRGGLVPRTKLETRFQKVHAGDWLELIFHSEERFDPRIVGACREDERLALSG